MAQHDRIHLAKPVIETSGQENPRPHRDSGEEEKRELLKEGEPEGLIEGGPKGEEETKREASRE